MKKTDLLQVLNRIAPFDLAQDWDNCGMQIDLGKEEVDRVFLALEITDKIIAEAEKCGVDMIITHHPMSLPKFEMCRLRTSNVNERHFIELVRKGIEVCAMHTCFDAAPGGINDHICKVLGIGSAVTFADGIPRIGRLKKPVKMSVYEKQVSEALGDPVGAVSGGDPDKLISRVAVCTGDGTEYWEAAYNAGADLFVTGEFKHHEASYCSESGMCYISAGHAGTEWIFVPCMEKQFGLLTMGQIEIYKTESHQEPFLRRI